MKSFFEQYKFHLLIFLASFAVYANTINHDYAWDDAIVITANERVQKGFKGIPELLYSYQSNKISDGYGYRPVTLITYAIEIGCFGMNPSIGHFNNILLYALLCVLIYQFLIQFFSIDKKWICLWITLLFTLHPLHTEVVANIKSRDEILAFLFGILALKQFLYYLEDKTKVKSVIATGIFLVLAFLSKESALLFIPILFLISFFKLRFTRQKLGKWAVSVGLIVLSFTTMIGIWKLSQSEVLLQDQTMEEFNKGQYRNDGFLSNPLVNEKDWEHILPTSIYLIVKSIGLFIVPYPLVHDYGYHQIPKIEGSNPIFILGVIGGFIYLFLVLRFIRSRNKILFGSLFFILSLFGYLHLIAPGKDLFAERFLFVPSLGLSIVLVTSLTFFFNKFLANKNQPTIIVSTIVPILLLYSLLTVNRNKAWENNGTLFKTDEPNLTHCVRANFNHAIYLQSQVDRGKVQNKKQVEAKIISLYENCIRISDQSYGAYINLGKIYMVNGDQEKARELFEKASTLSAVLSEPFFLLGNYYLTIEDYEMALFNFEKSLHNGKAKTENYYHIAICYIKLGQLKEAIAILEKGETYRPNQYEYFNLLSDLHFYDQNPNQASHYSNIALSLNPNEEGEVQKHRKRIDALLLETNP